VVNHRTDCYRLTFASLASLAFARLEFVFLLTSWLLVRAPLHLPLPMVGLRPKPMGAAGNGGYK